MKKAKEGCICDGKTLFIYQRCGSGWYALVDLIVVAFLTFRETLLLTISANEGVDTSVESQTM